MALQHYIQDFWVFFLGGGYLQTMQGIQGFKPHWQGGGYSEAGVKPGNITNTQQLPLHSLFVCLLYHSKQQQQLQKQKQQHERLMWFIDFIVKTSSCIYFDI